MEIFPAIDLLGGRVVRLERGDYNRVTVYGEDPSAIAEKFTACGAKYLHCVDLDGARDGTTVNTAFVTALAHSGMQVEIGGGIRNEDTIRSYLDCGVWRVILGTIAVRDPAFTGRMLAKYGEQIAIGVDLKDGFAAVSGWLEVDRLSCDDLLSRLRDQGAKGLIVTDISKDGMLSGTNRDLYTRLIKTYPSFQMTASGGVSTLDDVIAMRQLGMSGTIIGKAYYEGRIDLAKAIEVAR
ncbi:MAG: 1-(5-phosphoribosyl)-5-[Clostridia bacterium]|nr:1-(5-phosphoribosyl)-5-[(5-phosphoribosylamino)methylideneamino]imidazole-4-carboxamide isomerase [Clostridia bacterium]